MKKIKRLNKFISSEYRYLLPTVFILLLLVTAIFFYFSKYHNKIPELKSSNVANIEKLQGGSLRDIEEKLPEIINRYGANGALAWVRQGFKDQAITMFQCHTLTHLIGHRAFDYYGDNVEEALKGNPLDECEGGYVHGVEAQAVESGGDYRSELFKICSILLHGPSYGGCYHGAGHAFMLPSTTPQSALALCDGLAGGPTNSLDSCYNGVFSEYTNLIGGTDGHTGLPLANGPPFKLTEPAIKFCASFQTKYQVDCALEVDGFGFSPSSSEQQIESSMHQCLNQSYTQDLQVACMQSMADVSTQHGLPLRSIKPPQFIFTLNPVLKHAYITGVASETKQFIYNGQNKDWQVFCSAFPDSSDQDYCESFFKS